MTWGFLSRKCLYEPSYHPPFSLLRETLQRSSKLVSSSWKFISLTFGSFWTSNKATFTIHQKKDKCVIIPDFNEPTHVHCPGREHLPKMWLQSLLSLLGWAEHHLVRTFSSNDGSYTQPICIAILTSLTQLRQMPIWGKHFMDRYAKCSKRNR